MDKAEIAIPSLIVPRKSHGMSPLRSTCREERASRSPGGTSETGMSAERSLEKATCCKGMGGPAMTALESHYLPLGQAACTPVRLKHLFAIFRGPSALPGHRSSPKCPLSLQGLSPLLRSPILILLCPRARPQHHLLGEWAGCVSLSVHFRYGRHLTGHCCLSTSPSPSLIPQLLSDRVSFSIPNT